MISIILAGLSTGLAIGFGVLLLMVPFSAMHRAIHSV